MTTVLVIEDERPLLRALQLALQANGYTVVTAPTASRTASRKRTSGPRRRRAAQWWA